jgi:hypothetical protein
MSHVHVKASAATAYSTIRVLVNFRAAFSRLRLKELTTDRMTTLPDWYLRGKFEFKRYFRFSHQ